MNKDRSLINRRTGLISGWMMVPRNQSLNHYWVSGSANTNTFQFGGRREAGSCTRVGSTSLCFHANQCAVLSSKHPSIQPPLGNNSHTTWCQPLWMSMATTRQKEVFSCFWLSWNRRLAAFRGPASNTQDSGKLVVFNLHDWRELFSCTQSTHRWILCKGDLKQISSTTAVKGVAKSKPSIINQSLQSQRIVHWKSRKRAGTDIIRAVNR